MKRNLIALYLLTLFVSASCGKCHVAGQVVDLHTGEPVSGVMVYVHAFSDLQYKDYNSFVTTDARGQFETTTSGQLDLIRIWKPGFALASIEVTDESPLSPQLTIRKLQSADVVHRAGEFGAANGLGISVALNTSVGADSPDADFIIERDPTQPATYYIRMLGNGGVVPIGQAFGERLWVLIYNTPEAPATGYLDRATIGPTAPMHANMFYVRTADGSHYAKVLVYPGVGAPGTDFAGCRFECLYQPNGARDLEVEVDDSMHFPFSRFGISVPHNAPALGITSER